MNCALYARYSSENQREASIDDQFRNCEQYAARQGWAITHRYADKALSGSTHERPRYQQMLKDAQAKLFDVLLVDDFSRLSRDQIETEHARRRFIHWGVRLIGVTDGIDTAAKGHKMLSGFRSIVNEFYLDDLREKTTRGMIGQALKGFHCGGRAYGYKLVRELDSTQTDPYGQPDQTGTRLEIIPEQAQWVVWIFERYADGWSPLKIVEELNRQQIPPPGAAYRRRSSRRPSWCASALHGDFQQGTGLLNNPLYMGQRIWYRSRYEKDPDTKRVKRIARDRSEWIVTPLPELRIVSDRLWEQVKARQQQVREQHLHIQSGQTKTHAGRGPKYLFSGLLLCGQCGSKFVIADPMRYACSGWLYRGQSVCANTIKVSRSLVESRLLASLKDDLFTEEGVALFKQETARLLAEQRRATTPALAAIKRQLAQIQEQIAHMVTAIKSGFRSETLKQDLEMAEREKARLHEMLASDVKRMEKITGVLPNATQRFKRMLDEFATVTQPQVNKARSILKELVGQRITLHPSADGRERFLTAELAGDYAGLIRLVGGKSNLSIVNGKNNMVEGRGFEPPTPTLRTLCSPN